MKKFKNMLTKLAGRLRKESDKVSAINKHDLILSLNSKRIPRKPGQSDESKIRKILSRIAHDAEFLDIIKHKPESLMEKFELNRDDIKALRAADLLIVARMANPLLQQAAGQDAMVSINFPREPNTGVSTITNTGFSTVTLDSGSTCTVTNNVLASMADTVQSLKEMDSVHLAGLIQRLVEDEEFYNQTRNYFRL